MELNVCALAVGATSGAYPSAQLLRLITLLSSFVRLLSHNSDALAAVAGKTACCDQGKTALMAMTAAVTPAGVRQIVLCRVCADMLTSV